MDRIFRLPTTNLMHISNLEGRGLTLLPAKAGHIVDNCGPIDLGQGGLARCQMVTHFSNNVGELCALLHALRYVLNALPDTRAITIGYES